jgi:hypothetical protein
MLMGLYSCKSQQFPYSKTKTKQLNVWKKTLDEGKEQVKSYWIDLVDGKWDFFQKSYQTNLSEADVSSMNLVPIPIYTIDSISFYQATTKSTLIQRLNLDTNNALYLVKKDSSFVARIYPQWQSNQWRNGEGYSGLFLPVAQKLYSLYAIGIQIYIINIHPYYKHKYHYYFMAFDNGKDLMSIQSDGSEIPLMQDIDNLKRKLTSQYIW